MALHEDKVHDLLRETLIIIEGLLTDLSDGSVEQEAGEGCVLAPEVHERVVLAVEFHLVSEDVNLFVGPHLLIRLAND